MIELLEKKEVTMHPLFVKANTRQIGQHVTPFFGPFVDCSDEKRKLVTHQRPKS